MNQSNYTHHGHNIHRNLDKLPTDKKQEILDLEKELKKIKKRKGQYSHEYRQKFRELEIMKNRLDMKHPEWRIFK